MRFRQATAVLVLAAGASLPMAGVASAQDDKDCGDFATQQEAMEAHEQLDPEDAWELDRDKDGKPCETLPVAPPHETSESEAPPAPPARPGADGQVHRVPMGGVDTGDGSAAGDDSAAMPILLGVAGLGAATATAAFTARRARRSEQR
ncbi:putative calcium-binding protein [Saccharomonospora marina XMU15]|uniref:Putative calcium-binding protein n=1 Tax=Saccharomonospora marina XMU15 TaxID=882083 RepID=H5X116_9PSEU|nr:excalibur calcium-binding domain-containing protein [Saccharomonospora marina]EHR53075.1 putative calcium-binding protein [Saccharomonospora marina XMU15]